MVLPTIVVMVGGAVLRNLQGWLTPALADGQVDSYEWRRLAVTTVRVLFVAGLLHWGVDMSEEAATAVAMLADFVYGEVSKLVAIKKIIKK